MASNKQQIYVGKSQNVNRKAWKWSTPKRVRICPKRSAPSLSRDTRIKMHQSINQSITVVRKDTKKKNWKRRNKFFLLKFCHKWHFNWGGPGTQCHPPWLRLWFWDKIAPLSSFIKKTFKAKLKKKFFQNVENTSQVTWQFFKPPGIAWHYHDVDRWSSLLLVAFVRVNPKLKKLQFRSRTTYWLCSHYIYRW